MSSDKIKKKQETYIQWWPELIEHRLDLTKKSHCFYLILTWIFGMPALCNYSSVRLWHSVNEFAHNLNVNVYSMSSATQAKSFPLNKHKICSVYFPACLNFVDGFIDILSVLQAFKWLIHKHRNIFNVKIIIIILILHHCILTH